uniref:Photolyase/cryptochrome alpha/beta domain-containing protein n=1 Tax=Chromera velia CCMP2878 TaxID=1169474 RepID=A0A0G4I8G4_9ALVE|eukprot:Cvel_11852.t1-p1 / transcript=Cvel_11852.t1 / gene=Cvel_11852 / organism=Chromera_velia_CCMP2878 / gene_product=Cryptochrome-1, putative / transcript_product=Cryptochrome-1, putative / location=Cvel_scaffold756:1927-6207(+) / protein_length=789 / sequence_SO=supercontig / SO=protein_coding / is_pseudo=false
MPSPSSSSAPIAVLWLRRDLRLHDNPVLHFASTALPGYRILPVYIRAPYSGEEYGELGEGAAMGVWIHATLKSLDTDMRSRFGSGICFLRGDSVLSVLERVVMKTGAKTLLFSRRYDPEAAAFEEKVQKTAREEWRIKTKTFNSHLLYEPSEVADRLRAGYSSGHFGTLMPFVRTCRSIRAPTRPLPPPSSLNVMSGEDANLSETSSLDALDFLPLNCPSPWHLKLLASWDAGEAAGLHQMKLFVEKDLQHYERDRSKADKPVVSKLSPYIAVGCLSPRELYWAASDKFRPGDSEFSKTFDRRLFWRDLAYWQQSLFGPLYGRSIRGHYDEGMQWSEESAVRLKAWKRGKTGLPLIDAAMRQLWETGWIQQNVRMAVASFLTEYLNVDWREGARWFHDTLIDCDEAINGMMWQNAGRAGLDQWNFHIHPVTSARSSDASGQFVRSWVPQLAKLPTKFVHAPWEADPYALRTAAVQLGRSGYPLRVVRDLEEERKKTTKAVQEMQRLAGPSTKNAAGYDLISLPDGRNTHVFTRRDLRLQWGGDGSPAPFSSDGQRGKTKEGAGGGQADSPKNIEDHLIEGAGGAGRGRGGKRGNQQSSSSSAIRGGVRGGSSRDRGGTRSPSPKRLQQTSLKAWLKSSPQPSPDADVNETFRQTSDMPTGVSSSSRSSGAAASAAPVSSKANPLAVSQKRGTEKKHTSTVDSGEMQVGRQRRAAPQGESREGRRPGEGAAKSLRATGGGGGGNGSASAEGASRRTGGSRWGRRGPSSAATESFQAEEKGSNDIVMINID